jgi:beta-1,4-mannosyltransferase
MSRPRSQKRLVVLQSFAPPRVDHNPFTSMMMASLPGSIIDIRCLTWRNYLFGTVDVFHVHWPETLLRHPKTRSRFVKYMLFIVLLARLRLQRSAVVRTVHNRKPHASGPKVEQYLLRALDRRTTLWIHLSEEDRRFSEKSQRGNHWTIPLGHYKDWYSVNDVPNPSLGKLVTFGLVRPFKGVERLLREFVKLKSAGYTLTVAGRCETKQVAESVRLAADGDPRIDLILEHIPDDALAKLIGSAEMVILPYESMLNSSALLLALSLNRPVVVPRSNVSEAIAREVGQEWIVTYEGQLTAHKLNDALLAVRMGRRSFPPNLSERDWPKLGAQITAAYLEAARRPAIVSGARGIEKRV